MGKRKTLEEIQIEEFEQDMLELERREREDEARQRLIQKNIEEKHSRKLEEEWALAKDVCRQFRKTIERNSSDSEAYWWDQYARNRYGDLYTAEFAGEEDPTATYRRRSIPSPRSDDEASIAVALAAKKEGPPHSTGTGTGTGDRYDYYRPVCTGVDHLQEEWYYRPVPNLLFLAAVIYVVPWLAAVLVWEITRLPIHFFAGLLAWAARMLRDYVVLPPLRWLGRELVLPVVAGVFDVSVASWALYGSTWVLWRLFGFFESSGAALVVGKWALRACVVAVPWTGGERSRVAVRMYYCWAAYVVLCLVWWYWPASPTAPTPLSFVEMVEGGDSGPVVVRTVREALGADDRLFTFSMGRWERRIMDWFVDTGYTLRPCVFSDCMIPAEDRW
ncbi:hypothetical protein PG997_007922 [Apiospora hydei]|uniref:Uncharacterized protein n=1 Tax=Apiospora hydei TaxID=1337664 RepID=A0ABR1WD65_9PEZI